MARPKRISDEDVLAGTLRVMSRKGPAELTLALVAAEVGIAPATLLQRFGDKQGLIIRALTHDNADYARLLIEAPPVVGRESVLDLFWLMTPEAADVEALAVGMLWLREDFRDPGLNALSRERFIQMRAAIAARLPPLPIAPETAARMLEAVWQGAINQWGFFQEGSLSDYVARALNDWFDLAEGVAR
jgi:AcrR family transcriptional regulator